MENQAGQLNSFFYAIPNMADRRAIYELEPEDAWQEMPIQTAISALSKWGRADGNDYLERYPDVRQCNIDPITHFVTYGLEEYRFLKYRDSNYSISLANARLAESASPKFDELGLTFSLEFKKSPFEDPFRIAYITDKNYVIPTMVSIFSLFANRNNEHYYEINIICIDIDNYSDLYLLKTLNSHFFQIKFIKLDREFYKSRNFEFETHVTPSSLIKFFLPEIFPNIDRILYIDGDTIINGDISPLKLVSLEGIYLAAALDPLITFEWKHAEKVLGLSRKLYFNSGVMLMNLRSMRTDKIPGKLLDYRTTGKNIFMDQDALNYVMGNHIRYLNVKYNLIVDHLFTVNLHKYLSLVSDMPADSSREQVVSQAIVLHYASPAKPWKNPYQRFGSYWQDYKEQLDACLDKSLETSVNQNLVEYWIKRYYYSDDGINSLPGYHEIIYDGDKKRKKKHLSWNFQEYKDRSLPPMCLSPDVVPLTITLTSRPDRLDAIAPTIYSLLNQKSRPENIILWLAEDEFENGLVIPDNLLGLQEYGLTIEVIKKSLKVYNKLLPALMKYGDRPLVTCDDDIYYEKNWLARLHSSWKKEKNYIHAMRARKIVKGTSGEIAPYGRLGFAKIRSLGYEFIPTGVGGVLYPPGCFHPDVTDLEKISQLSPYADDLWYWAMGVLNGSKIRVADEYDERLVWTDVQREMHGDTLGRRNVEQCANDNQLKNLFNAYPRLYSVLNAAP